LSSHPGDCLLQLFDRHAQSVKALIHNVCASFPMLRCYDSPMRFIEDDKLPSDVIRKEYSESRHALCCLNCGFESEFAPHLPDSIGKPLYVLMVHDCPNSEAAD
jgi:hypothetical protein